MKENQNIEVKTKQQPQQGHDYFLYFSYIVLIAVIIFLFQHGAYEFIRNMDFTQVRHYLYAAFFVLTILFVLCNFLTILGFIFCYALFQFALALLEKSNL